MEVQSVESCHAWVLGKRVGSTGRGAHSLYHHDTTLVTHGNHLNSPVHGIDNHKLEGRQD